MERIIQKSALTDIGIIFDMDGVIIDTCRLHENAWFEVSKLYGFPWNKAINFKNDVFGTSSVDSAIILFGQQVRNCNMKEICCKKDEFYLELLHSNIHSIVIPGFIQFFETLMQLKIPVALATSSVFAEAEAVLKKLDIIRQFKAIIDISKVNKPKPSPEIYLRACDALGLPVSKCIGFEDSLTGIKALQDAGIKCIVVGSTLTRERLNERGLSYRAFINDFSRLSIHNLISDMNEDIVREVI